MKDSAIVSILLFLAVVVVACGHKFDFQEEVILKEVSAINAATHLKEISLDAEAFLENQPDGGAELKGIYEAGAIRKISLWVGLSNGIETKDYYFKNGNLILVHEQFNGFLYDTESEAFDPGKTEKTFNGRYFFKHGKLLNYETTGHNRFEDDTIDPGITLLTEAKDYSELLGRKL